jgi:antitoxin CptB
MGEDDRIRWHCRRGLLELDLVLSKFLNTRYSALTNSQKAVFIELIEYSDNDLWDLLSGRTPINDPAIADLIKLFD